MSATLPTGTLLLDAIEASDLGMIVTDGEGRLAFINRKAAELFGLSAVHDKLGGTLTGLGGESGPGANLDGDMFAYLGHRLTVDARRTAFSFERARLDGGILGVAARPLPNGGYVLTFTDVTDQHLAAERLHRANRATVIALANFSESRDSDTGTHVLRVARLTEEIARDLYEKGRNPEHLDRRLLESIAVASILHDVGKIATPDSILTKPGPLTAEERRVMETHAVVGASLLAEASLLATDSPYLNVGVEIARSHHEKYDGTGYPDRRKGDEIPLAARIVAVADVFDALTSKRPYKEPWPTEKAVALVCDGAGTQFDPLVVQSFAVVMERRMTNRAIVWNPSMSVGDNRLDNEHMVLIEVINQLVIADNRRDRHILEMTIDELISYASFHFRHEEEYMARAGYPGRDDHIGQHRAFTNKMLRVRDSFLTHRRMAVGDEILIFLRHWLTQHILIEDMAYRRFIADRASGGAIL